MTEKCKRFGRVLNKTVIHMTAAEAAEAQTRFDGARARSEEAGAVNEGNAPWMYAALWAGAHYGADAVQVVEDGVELEPLTHRIDGTPIAEAVR